MPGVPADARVMHRTDVHSALLALTMTVAASASATIYRCPDGEGGVEFTDLACRDGARAEVSSGTGISLPPLSEAELTRMQQLERDAGRRRAEHERDRARAAAAARREAEVRRDACTGARRALEAIRDARRKGYTLAEDAQLTREEARHDATVRTQCRR